MLLLRNSAHVPFWLTIAIPQPGIHISKNILGESWGVFFVFKCFYVAHSLRCSYYCSSSSLGAVSLQRLQRSVCALRSNSRACSSLEVYWLVQTRLFLNSSEYRSSIYFSHLLLPSQVRESSSKLGKTFEKMEMWLSAQIFFLSVTVGGSLLNQFGVFWVIMVDHIGWSLTWLFTKTFSAFLTFHSTEKWAELL